MKKPMNYVLTITSKVGMAMIFAAGFGSISLPSLAAATDAPVSFAKQILPIFIKNCNSCHAPGGVGEITTALDLTGYKELRMGSVGGVTIVPFHSDRSPLMHFIKDNWTSKNTEALKMPPPPYGSMLSPQDIQTIADWIDQGAKNN